MKFLFLALALAPWISGEAAQEVIINGSGASMPAPLIAAWGAEYQKKTGVQVTYQAIGSDGGVRQIADRTVDFGVTEEPVPENALEKDKLWQFAIVQGGVVPVVHLEGVKAGELVLSGTSLADIFLGKIKFWDDPSMQQLNPNLKLPHEQIHVIYRSEGSGITAIFTNYLSALSPAWKKGVGAGSIIHFPVGDGAKGSDGVMNKMAELPNSIGYVDYTFAIQHKLTYTALHEGGRGVVQPAPDQFMDPPKWPIMGTSYILLTKEKKESNQKVVNFFNWALTDGDKNAQELGYAPLSFSTRTAIKAYWKELQLIP